MAKPNKILITEEGVLSNEALLAYAQGKLSPAETAQVEKMLAADPFLQDALDGIKQASAAQTTMPEVVATLRQNLRNRAGVKERKKGGFEIHWANYAYAAVIFGVLMGLGYVMIQVIGSEHRDLALNTATQAQDSTPVVEEKKPEPPKPDTTHLVGTTTVDTSHHSIEQAAELSTKGQDTKVAEVFDTKVESTQTKAIKTLEDANTAKDMKQNTAAPATAQGNSNTGAKPVLNAVGNSAGVTQTAPSAKTATTTKGAKEEEGQNVVNGHRVLSNETTTKPDKDKNTEAATKSNAKAKLQTPVSTETISNTLMLAKTLFDAGEYRAAEKKYGDALNADPANPEAMYFGAISSYINGNTKQAEPKFDKLLQKGIFTEGSKWYKANILIKKGKTDEAKPLLRDLINSNSNFRDRAVKKYEEIGK